MEVERTGRPAAVKAQTGDACCADHARKDALAREGRGWVSIGQKRKNARGKEIPHDHPDREKNGAKSGGSRDFNHEGRDKGKHLLRVDFGRR